MYSNHNEGKSVVAERPIYSNHNEGKSVVAEKFIRSLKGKIYKK